MFRSLLTAMLLYGYGHPSLDGYRPAALDRPLQGLHVDVNQTAADVHRALKVLDDVRCMRYLQGTINHLSAVIPG